MKKAKIRQRAFTVILRVEREGGYSVQSLELPGAISEGETKKEALKNIRDAIKGYLEAFPDEAQRLKITAKAKKGSLLDYVRSVPPDE